MIRSHDSQSAFDRWLDATLAGESTPADVAIDADPDATLRSTAHQVHALLRSADRDEGVTGRLDSIWENLDMHASPSAPRMGAMTGAGAPSSRRGLPPVSRHRHTANAINLVLTAVLILGLGFGAWQTWSAWNTNGGGDPQPTAELAASGTPGTFGEHDVPPAGTDLERVPTAEDCTIEPLDAETIVRYIEEPQASSVGTPLPAEFGGNAKSDERARGATPYAEQVGPGNEEDVFYPTEETIDVVAGLQWMAHACMIANSPLHFWAILDPFVVKQLAEIYLPQWTSRDDALRFFEDVATGKRVLENTPLVEQYGVGGDVAFSLVNPDVSQSLQRDKGILRVGIVTYDANGTYLNKFKAVDPYESGTGAPEVEYRWYAPEGRWVLMSLSFGGRA